MNPLQDELPKFTTERAIPYIIFMILCVRRGTDNLGHHSLNKKNPENV